MKKEIPSVVLMKFENIKKEANEEYERLRKLLNDWDWFNNPEAWIERHFGKTRNEVLDDRGIMGLVSDLADGKTQCLDEMALADIIIKTNVYCDWMSYEGADFKSAWLLALARYQNRFDGKTE